MVNLCERLWAVADLLSAEHLIAAIVPIQPGFYDDEYDDDYDDAYDDEYLDAYDDAYDDA